MLDVGDRRIRSRKADRATQPRSRQPKSPTPKRKSGVGSDAPGAPAVEARRQNIPKAIALGESHPLFITAAVAMQLGIMTVSNTLKYLNGDGPDVLVAASVLISLIAVLFARPRGVMDVFAFILLFLFEALVSIKHEWVETPYLDIARAVGIVILSGSCFLVGASLQQNSSSRSILILQGIGFALYAIVLVATVGILRSAKNTMGGMMFELAMFVGILQYMRSGELTWRFSLILAAAVCVGAVMTNHRAMLGIGALIGSSLAFFCFYRPPWIRAIPPLVGIVVAIAAVVLLTSFTQSAEMGEINSYVTQATGRTLMSGRQSFWGPLVDAIAAGPMVGYGPTKLAREVTGLEFSAHNAFLQVGLNYGWVGMVCVAIILCAIVRRAVKAPVTSAGAFLSVFLAAVIVHNSSENVLFQNDFPIAALTWINMGLLVACCRTPPYVHKADVPRLLLREQ